MALLCAIFYGVNTTFSKLAYDAGTNPVSLTVYRYLFIILILTFLVLVLRKNWKIQVPARLYLGCVLGMYLISIGHLGAVKFIPVSLAAIVFYTFPLMVIAYKKIVSGKPVSWLEALGFVLAFTGLAIALGVELHSLNWLGVAMALSGSIGAAMFIICYENFPPQDNPYATTWWITLGTVVLCLTSLLWFDLQPPVETIGWVYLFLIAATTVVAFVLTLLAIELISGATFSLFLNLEPVVILLLSWLVVGESLTVNKVMGISMVVAALFISARKPVSAN